VAEANTNSSAVWALRLTWWHWVCDSFCRKFWPSVIVYLTFFVEDLHVYAVCTSCHRSYVTCLYVIISMVEYCTARFVTFIHQIHSGYGPAVDFVDYICMITSPAGAVAKYCDKYVCVSVCLSMRIFPEPHAWFLPNFLRMLPMSVAWSSDMFTIVHVAYWREGVLFPIENALLTGKGGWECTARAKCAIYDCLVCYLNFRIFLFCSQIWNYSLSNIELIMLEY